MIGPIRVKLVLVNYDKLVRKRIPDSGVRKLARHFTKYDDFIVRSLAWTTVLIKTRQSTSGTFFFLSFSIKVRPFTISDIISEENLSVS